MYSIKDTQYNPTSKINLSGYATINHKHQIADVEGLSDTLANHQTVLDNKADKEHTHEISEINGLDEKLNSTGGLTLEELYPVSRLWMTVEVDQQPGTVLGFGTLDYLGSISLNDGVRLHIFLRME